jgi:hypothetical protein
MTATLYAHPCLNEHQRQAWATWIGQPLRVLPAPTPPACPRCQPGTPCFTCYDLEPTHHEP